MFTYHVKEEKSRPDLFIEVARKKQGFLFDELGIVKIEMILNGVQVHTEYERHGVRIRDMRPIPVAADTFTKARVDSGGDMNKWVGTSMFESLFAEASRQWLERNQKAENNILEDMAFLDGMKQ